MRLKIKSTVVLIVLPVRGTESIFTATLKTRNSYFFVALKAYLPGFEGFLFPPAFKSSCSF